MKSRSRNPVLPGPAPRTAPLPERQPAWDLDTVLKVQAERRQLVETARRTMRRRP